MRTTILALGAAVTLLGSAALAQTPNDQAQADYQAKQAQYQDKQAQYQDQKAQYEGAQAQYRDQKAQYHHEMARWAAGQVWPERYWGDHYVVSDWGVAHLRDPGRRLSVVPRRRRQLRASRGRQPRHRGSLRPADG